ncbi:MAG: Clp protease ClpP [Clostridiales bacterium]|nr:Clp protease ClpP [Clostridiales bacterium]
MSKKICPVSSDSLRPYNIASVGDNDAEISLYGEVVSTRPIDWWTGEPIPGNFIALDEFLKDLDELGTKDNITVHINSVGGDMYAGIAIHNRLKGLAANITTINDGLAASAGSLIFMAGDHRKVHAGSNLMIHGAAAFMYGYYQVQDLQAGIKQLNAHNKAGINIYVAATGRTESEIMKMVEAETWLTGQEAVDEGFADEVIGEESEGVEMCLTPDKSTVIVNGYPVAARCLGSIPKNLRIMTAEEWTAVKRLPERNMQPAPQDSINKNLSGGTDHMEIKNVDELRAAYPDFMAQAEAEAKSEGVKAERARIQGIEEIENAIGDPELVNKAKFGDMPMNAEQLAFAAMKAQSAVGVKVLKDIADDAKNSGAAQVTPTPSGEGELTEDQKAEAFLAGIAKNMKEGK